MSKQDLDDGNAHRPGTSGSKYQQYSRPKGVGSLDMSAFQPHKPENKTFANFM